MIGTLINCAAIVLGTCLGLLLRRGMKPAVSHTVMQGVGLSVILIGLMGAIETDNTLLVILSMMLGGVAGALVGCVPVLPVEPVSLAATGVLIGFLAAGMGLLNVQK